MLPDVLAVELEGVVIVEQEGIPLGILLVTDKVRGDSVVLVVDEVEAEGRGHGKLGHLGFVQRAAVFVLQLMAVFRRAEIGLEVERALCALFGGQINGFAAGLLQLFDRLLVLDRPDDHKQQNRAADTHDHIAEYRRGVNGAGILWIVLHLDLLADLVVRRIEVERSGVVFSVDRILDGGDILLIVFGVRVGDVVGILLNGGDGRLCCFEACRLEEGDIDSRSQRDQCKHRREDFDRNTSERT